MIFSQTKVTLLTRMGPRGQVANQGRELYADPHGQDHRYRRRLTDSAPLLIDLEGLHRLEIPPTVDRNVHVVAPLLDSESEWYLAHTSKSSAIRRLSARKSVVVMGTTSFLLSFLPSASQVVILEFDEDKESDEYFPTASELMGQGFKQLSRSVRHRGFTARGLVR